MSMALLDWFKFFGLLGLTVLMFAVMAADLARLSATPF
jgi:hypothetical protein